MLFLLAGHDETCRSAGFDSSRVADEISQTKLQLVVFIYVV